MARKRKRQNPEISKDPSRRYEPLREELREYVEVCGGVPFLRHPFCNVAIADLKSCGWINDSYDSNAAEYDACFEAHDYEGCLRCIDITLQPEWLAKDAWAFTDAQYWRLLAMAHGNQRTTIRYRDLFDELFRAERLGREHLMTDEERAIFARLPKRLRVYRGYSGDDLYADGIAWTLDQRQALWYANWHRSDDDPMIASGTVSRDDIWAYLEGGNILLPSEKVRNRLDEDALNPAARVPWSEFISPEFDVTTLLRK